MHASWMDAMKVLTFVNSNKTLPECASSSFSTPLLFGAEIISLSAEAVFDYSATTRHEDIGAIRTIEGLRFCNVTITYTHPGQDDTINTEIWLPLDGWNNRFMGTGGGGFSAGRNTDAMSAAVERGFSVSSTDAGHTLDMFFAESWALKSPGNINWALLQDFAHIALNDAALLGKDITEQFYGSKPKFSYWNGCSTGGRQGLMMAQRYPDVYDGLLIAAPAINWAKFVPAMFWPQLVMNLLGYYPPRCELEAITTAVIEQCDGLDGVVDGIISAPDLCHVDDKKIVGRTFSCTEGGAYVKGSIDKKGGMASSRRKITKKGLKIAHAAWDGPKSLSGENIWPGASYDTAFTVAGTECKENLAKCEGSPFVLAVEWIKRWIAKDPTFDVNSLTHAQFDEIMRQSENQYKSIMSTDDTDLSPFRTNKHKILMWHGLSDSLIPPRGSELYYTKVLEKDQYAREYFRYFEAPGAEHCGNGHGFNPDASMFDELMKWVEKGKAPDSLLGVGGSKEGDAMQRPLCPWPLVAGYKGGDVKLASSFECRAGFANATNAEAGV